MKIINYKGKGEHSIKELELIIEQQAEELHFIKSGQKPLIVNSVIDQKELLCGFFMFFRANGESNIGMSIEQFVDCYINK